MTGGVVEESSEICIAAGFEAAGGGAVVTVPDVLMEEVEFFHDGVIGGERYDMANGDAPREASNGVKPSFS